ncbi:ABC transporter substrate-binding protein [Streptococcus caviae]|uniref:ABC transporter substrate-binding protein n=1 Tax=Streptococcus sp. 'caviae' TaxID=1915004 RepID=UPI00094B8CF3|nr:extracellular solute-binding protein [Streptococcus sp. 'caviae']OLN83136.1 sugar-binding protein [Streptococcus sp. 'caviae']
MIKQWIRRRKFPLIGGLVLLAAVLSFFVFQSRQKKILRLGVYAGSSWDVPSGKEYQFLDEVISRFEKKHPNVEVQYESGILKEDYSSWLSGKIVEGTQPDVFVVPENDFNLLASTGALANLDSRIKKELKTSQFYSSAYNAGHFGQNQFALPFESNPVMMCINIDLLKKEGIKLPASDWTIADFYNICKKVTKDTDGDGVIDQYGSFSYGWEEALAAYNIKLFNKTGTEAYFNTKKVRSALSLVTKLKNLNGSYRVTLKDFDEGRVAFFPMTLAQYRTYKPYPYHVSKYSSFSWSCVEMPSQKSSLARTQSSTSLYAISAKTSQSKLAWEFLKLLCADKKTQQQLFEDSQGASVLKSVMNSQESKNLLQNDSFGAKALTVSTLDSMLKKATTTPRFKSYNTIYEKAGYLITKSLEEDTVESDLSDIQKDIEDELK